MIALSKSKFYFEIRLVVAKISAFKQTKQAIKQTNLALTKFIRFPISNTFLDKNDLPFPERGTFLYLRKRICEIS